MAGLPSFFILMQLNCISKLIRTFALLKPVTDHHLFILFLFFLTGFTGFIFYLFNHSVLEKIRRPGLLLALGTLGGTIFFHLIPEYVEHHHSELIYGAFAIPGFLVWLIPGFLRKDKSEVKPSIVALIAGDAIHNAFTSILWLSLCMATGRVEMMVVPAIILHEIPHKAGNFGIMIFSGLPRRVAMLLNVFASLFFFAGMVLFSSHIPFNGKIFMPVIIGTLSYTFFSGLYHERPFIRKPGSLYWLAGGFLLMVAVSFLTGGWH